MNVFTPEFSRDTEQYDHKFNGCGITYEIGAHLFQDSLIWMNGPFKDGANNNEEKFVEHGLKNNLKEICKKSLGEKYTMVTQMKSAHLILLIVTQLQNL